MQTRHLTHREDPKAASKLKDPEYSFRSWYLSDGERVWVSSRTGKPALPEQEGTTTLHPAMAWAHGLRLDPEDYPWAGERPDIRAVFWACSTVIIKGRLSTAPHSDEQTLCTSRFPSPLAFDPVLWTSQCWWMDWHLSGATHRKWAEKNVSHAVFPKSEPP